MTLELQDAAQTYRGARPVHALRPTSLVVPPGSWLSIVGPSGSGKSTLLNLLGLLALPSDGRYLVDGVDVETIGERGRAGLRASLFGFVFQTFHLAPDLDALENVELALMYQGASPVERRRRAEEALVRVGLERRLRARPSILSGGEQQRVAIARATVGSREVLLCDEPTGNLDSRNGAQVLDLFAELHQQGLTLVVVTHDRDVAARGAEVLEVVDGVLATVGDPGRVDAR